MPRKKFRLRAHNRADKNQKNQDREASLQTSRASNMQLLEPKNMTKDGIPTVKSQVSNNSHGEEGRKAVIQVDNPQVGKQVSKRPKA